MSFNKILLLWGLAGLVACTHDYNNPLDPLNLPDNIPPVARFTCPDSAITGQSVEFDASESFDEDGPKEELQLRWDFFRDGTWEREGNWNQCRIVTHAYPNAGLYWVRLEVEDSWGKKDGLEKPLKIKDPTSTIPPFAIFNIIPATGRLTTDFVFDASNSKNHTGGTVGLEYRWRFNDGTTWEPWQANASAGSNYSTSGQGLKKISLEVRETSTGLTALATAQMSVTPPLITRNNPTALFMVTPPRGTTATQFTVDAGPSKDQEDAANQLQVQWNFQDGKGWSVLSPNRVNSVTYGSPGHRTIYLHVQDTDGDISEATVQVYVE